MRCQRQRRFDPSHDADRAILARKPPDALDSGCRRQRTSHLRSQFRLYLGCRISIWHHGRRAFSLVLVVLTTVAVNGCGEKSARRTVAGDVTFQGQPIAQGTIQFLQMDPPSPVGGAMIQAGRYSLSGTHGLLPGTYRVTISAPDSSTKKVAGDPMKSVKPTNKELIPNRYNSNSELTVVVTSDGPNTFDFTLK